MSSLKVNDIDAIDIRTQHIVFGYARKIIPIKDIIYIILFYYFDGYKFDDKYCSLSCMDILDNGTTIKNKNSSWNTCIFGGEISSKQCNKFTIYVKWKKLTSYFYLGYIFDTKISTLKLVQSNGLGLGEGNHKSYSVGLFTQSKQFGLYDINNRNTKLNYTAKEQFKSGDIFKLCFDFINDEWSIYHNDIYADKLSLNGCKKIIPAISIFCKDEAIQITKWSFQ